MLEITSRHNQKIKDACALKMKKVRIEKGLFLMEGIKNLDMALNHGVVRQIFTTIDLPNLRQDVEVYKINDEILRKLAVSENPEGVVFVCDCLRPKKKMPQYHKIVYLDQVNDPGNLGTIIRTAVAFDYDAVVLSKGSVDLYNDKVVAASKGSIFLIDAFYADINDFAERYEIIASSLDEGSIDLNDCPKYENFVLVLGNESHGVSEQVLSRSHRLVKIAMSDQIDSLNVAIAGGILMNYFK